MKKRLFILLSLFALTVILIVLANRFLSQRGKSNDGLNNYVIADTASVDRIKITMSIGYTIDLVKKGTVWQTADGKCIQQELVHNILHTFRNIAIKSYVPKDAIENINKNIAINYRKVEIFQNGKWSKTWYVGASTADHYGTYVRLETPDGMQKATDILEMRGLHGTIEPRFFADYRQWACTQIFALKPEEIKEIKVENYQDSSKSFRIVNNSPKDISLYFDGKKIENFNKVNMNDYLHRYENVHFNMPNYILNDAQVDSVKAASPYYKLSITDKNNKTTHIVTHRIALKEPDYDIFGVPSYYELGDMWAFINETKIVKVQYFVFDKLAVGRDFFVPKN